MIENKGFGVKAIAGSEYDGNSNIESVAYTKTLVEAQDIFKAWCNTDIHKHFYMYHVEYYIIVADEENDTSNCITLHEATFYHDEII